MSRTPLLRTGYLYRLIRKVAFLLKRGSLFSKRNPAPGSGGGSLAISSGTFRVISINSTFLFLLSYLILFLGINLITMVASYSFNIHPVLDYTGLSFFTQNSGWTFDAVQIIYSAGPVLALITAFIAIMIYLHVSEETGVLKLLMLWMFAQSLVFFLGDVIMGSMFARGFGYVLMYLYVDDTVKMVIGILGICLMVILGLAFANLFLGSANSYFQELHSSYNRRFLFNQFLYPFLAGNLILFLIRMPRDPLYDLYMNGTMIFFLVPLLIKGSSLPDHTFSEEQPPPAKISFRLAAVCLLAMALFRIAFSYGFHI